jgi:hypothetical protein
LGIVLCFLGRKFFPLTVRIGGFIVGFMTTLLLFQAFKMLDNTKQIGKESGDQYIFIFFSVVISIIVAFFLSHVLEYMLEIAAFLIGAFGGYVIATTFYIMILPYNFWL